MPVGRAHPGFHRSSGRNRRFPAVEGIDRQTLHDDGAGTVGSSDSRGSVADYLVLRVSEVEREVVLPVAAREVIVDGKLPALVVEDTAVLLGDRGAEGSGDDRGEEDIFRTLVEVVEVDAQGILEERRIHTDVEGLGGLPRQQFITHGEHQALNRDAVETVSVGPSAVGGHEIVVAHILLVTVQTVRSTEFQVADTVAVSLHEILLRHAPAQRYRREEGAVALLEELRRHIVTGGEFEIVAVVVGVSGAAEERLQRTAVFALRRELGAFRGNRTVARLVRCCSYPGGRP